MGDGSLSQDEIDALLQGADDMLSPTGGGGFEPQSMTSSPMSGGSLSPMERDSIRDVMNRVMGAIAPSLSGYLQKNISITNATVEIKSRDAIVNEFLQQYVQVQMGYNGGLNGQNLVIFSKNDAGVISSLMMGDESGKAPSELSDAHQSTLQEFVSSLLSSVANQLVERVGAPINTVPPTISIANSGAELQLPAGEIVKITYSINIDGILNSSFFHIMEINLAGGLARSTGGGGGGYSSVPSQGQQMGGFAQQMTGNVNINPVKFPPLGGGMPPGVGQNIGLLMDVMLSLTVELGRTKMLVKDILGLGEGSIIELEKLAGEPVDLLVNNKLIAKGEVVVIDENFGVRVTDIVSPSDRLHKIGNQ
ncbi:MAG: flagellar motor switch protein FliN [Spirochaetes bacterium]|nr:flagellar motor switch protein FliN [Spirochaetota bacterium]